MREKIALKMFAVLVCFKSWDRVDAQNFSEQNADYYEHVG